MNSSRVISRILILCISAFLGLQIGCTTPGAGGAGAAGITPSAATTPVADDRTNTTYQPGDKIEINFADNQGIPPIWPQTVREDGTITLPLNQSIVAAGLRKGELEKAIQELYVPRILKRLTVNVRAEQRTYFVTGEVKNPGQREHTGLITAMKAVAASGDFTDFANKGRIEVIRATGEKVKVNGKEALKDPSKDVPVYPGDRVHVYRRIF